MPLLRQGPSSSFLLAVAASLVVCIQQLQTAEAGTIGGSKVRVCSIARVGSYVNVNASSAVSSH